MKNISKVQLFLLLFSSVDCKIIISSDTEDVCTPRSTPRAQKNIADQELSTPQDRIGYSPFGLSGSSREVSAYSPFVAREVRSCTPPQTTPLEDEFRQIVQEASSQNQAIVLAIHSQLIVLKSGAEESVDLWKGIFENLKEIKDSPQKPDLKKRTIMAIGKIIAKEAFDILKKNHPASEDQIGAMFRAELRNNDILKIVQDASVTFQNQVDISTLPAWIVKKCFEKVENDCRSPEKHAGLRTEILGLPLVRSLHIAHGHALQNRDGGVAQRSVLKDPRSNSMSLVWTELQKIADDGSPKKKSNGKICLDSDIRKTLFPLGMNENDIKACILRAVQNPKKGVALCSSCELSLYQDPETKLFIQTIDSAGGALVGTAYPVRILTKEECAQSKNGFVDIMQKLSHVHEKKGEIVRFSIDEILSSVKISDRIIADCGDTIVVEIGHIDPLCSLLVNSEPQQVAFAVKASPSKGKKDNQEESGKSPSKGKRGKQEEDFNATKVGINTRISQYCPIGIEVAFSELQELNNGLHEKIQTNRLEKQARSSLDKALGVA